jgi:uncharacterized metal-binding protein YceD (DUF177 family)
MTVEAVSPPEFSHPIKLDVIEGKPRAFTLAAGPAERTALAKRFGLISIKRFDASLSIRREGATVYLTGTITAKVTAPCVATGVPVPLTVKEAIAIRFMPVEAHAPDVEIELDVSDDDVIDHDGKMVDVGEAVSQSLGLAIPLFPRSANADQVLSVAGVKREGELNEVGSLGRMLQDTLNKPAKGGNS